MTVAGSGKLLVDVRHDGRCIVELTPQLTRPSEQVGGLLKNREADQAVMLLGMLFSICTSAHQAAAERALADARGVSLDSDNSARLEQQVVVERIRESAMRLLMDWHYPCDNDEVLTACVRCCHLLNRSLGSAECDVAEQVDALARWWRATRCGSTDHQIWIAGRCERFGGIVLNQTEGRVPLEGGLNAADLLASRLNALVDQIDRGIALLTGDSTVDSIGAPAGVRANGRSVGWALTSRGWLMHEVSLDGNRVSDWRILAPTDRNFHTRGKLWQLLRGVAVEPEEVEALVRTLTLAIDPCVAFEVNIRDA